MRLRNDAARYGAVAVILHWAAAAVVLGLFALGLWMTGLTYYDAWYERAPWLHEGIGMTLMAVMLGRLGWRRLDPRPAPLPSHAPWERRLATLAHALLYGLILAVGLSGYLIATADGHPLEPFGLLELPPLVTGIEHQEDVAGKVHLLLASILVGLAGLHALAALKHHFIDGDRTLLRMLGR